MTVLPLPEFRDFQHTDLPAIAQAMGDARVTRYYGLDTTHTDPLAIAREQLHWYRTLDKEGEGWWQAITIDGSAIGALGAYERDDDGDSAELGYWLLPAHWGHGHMQTALRLWLPGAFAHLRLHSIVAYVEPDNAASARLLAALGFQYEGLLRECTKRATGYASLQRYSLLASELPGLQPGN